MTVLIAPGYPASKGTRLSTTTTTAVYTVPSGFVGAQGVSMNLCNVDGTAGVDATVEWYDLSTTTAFKIRSTLSVAADNFASVDLAGLALHPGDELRVTAGAADDLHVVVTVMEFPR